MLRNLFLATVVLGTALSSPAIAQDDAAASRDTITIGAGAAVLPRYEGSDDSLISPVGAIRGKVSGISFSTVGTGLFVDLVPSKGGPGTKFVLGPVVHLSLNRSSTRRLDDAQIARLGRIKPAVEAGGHVGISRTGLITSDYDNLTLDVAVTHDVSGIHDALLVTPSVSYGTPLSRKIFVGISASADYVGGGYARDYFGVTPAQSLRSGLAAYTPGDGVKSASFGGVANFSITGDLRRGLSVFALGNYSKLLGEFGRSPVVRDKNQLIGALGVAYTF